MWLLFVAIVTRTLIGWRASKRQLTLYIYILKWLISPLLKMLLYFQTIWTGEKQKVFNDKLMSARLLLIVLVEFYFLQRTILNHFSIKHHALSKIARTKLFYETYSCARALISLLRIFEDSK